MGYVLDSITHTLCWRRPIATDIARNVVCVSVCLKGDLFKNDSIDRHAIQGPKESWSQHPATGGALSRGGMCPAPTPCTMDSFSLGAHRRLYDMTQRWHTSAAAY